MPTLPEADVRARLDAVPRVRLAHLPTPLDRLDHLSARLGPEILVKRDDLTGLALGGDKPRKLEYELARALDEGADVVVTCGSAQSNHARLTTAAARVLGLDAAVVLSRDTHAMLQGNLLVTHLLGAQVHLVDAEDHWALEEPARRLCDDLRAQGRRPHYVPASGTTPTSCLGYVRAGFELVDQLRARDLTLDALYTPFGTGGISAGLLLALRACGVATPLVGISVNRDRETCLANLRRWTASLHVVLGLDEPLDLGAYEVDDAFVGAGYGDATEATLDAVLQVARSDGVLLDPVYTGKAAAGLLAHQRAGRWTAGHRVALLHSGGVPALFAYDRELGEHLRGRDGGDPAAASL